MTNITDRRRYDAVDTQGTLIVYFGRDGVFNWDGNGSIIGTGWVCRLKPGLEVLREALGAA